MDLLRHSQRCFAQVADEVEGALLYVDEGAGEALHYIGGLPFVLQLGVRAVCSLENASALDAAVAWREGKLHKVAILTTRFLSDAHRYILRCLRCHPSVKTCTIFTSISQDAHSACLETPLGKDAFSEYITLLKQDLQHFVKQQTTEEDDFQSQGYSESLLGLNITVDHVPMVMCPLTPSLFVLPSGGAEAEAPLSYDKNDTSLGPGLPAVDTGMPLDLDDHIPSGATLIAHFLQHLTAQLDLKVEVFSLGPLSQMVGKLVTDLAMPTTLEHGAQRKSAGLLLVDRTLDLITPTCHSDAVIDRVVDSLLRRPKVLPPSRPLNGLQSHPLARNPMDFRLPTGAFQNGGNGVSEFPLLPLMSASDSKTPKDPSQGQRDGVRVADVGKAQVMGGSLAAPWDQLGADRLDALLDKSTKDATVLLRKWLHEALRKEKLLIPGRTRLGAMTPAELASLRVALSSKPDTMIRHLGLLQVAKAVEEALGSEKWSKWEALASAERILKLSVNDGSQSVPLQISDMVQQTTQDAMLNLCDVLTLAVVGYGLAGEATPNGPSSTGPFAWQEEAVLKQSLLDVILEGHLRGADLGIFRRLEAALNAHWQRARGDQSGGDQGKGEEKKSTKQNNVQAGDDWGEWEGVDEVSEEEEYGEAQLKLELRDQLEDVFSVFHQVAGARARLPASLRSSEEQAGVFPMGLLQRLFSLIFSKADVPGLQQHSSTVGRFFKSGLGRFGLGQPKPKLGDHKLIIVFIVGGIKGSEVREIREAQAGVLGGESMEVLIGGTTFLTPADMHELLLGTKSTS